MQMYKSISGLKRIRNRPPDMNNENYETAPLEEYDNVDFSNTYRSHMTCSVSVFTEHIPCDLRTSPLYATPSTDFRQNPNSAVAAILFAPFPVSATCHFGTTKKAFRLYLSAI